MAATTPSPSLCSYGGGPASSTPTLLSSHRLVPVGEGHNAFICCKGGTGCQSPTLLSLQFLGLLRSNQVAEEMTSQDCLEHAKISAGRGFC